METSPSLQVKKPTSPRKGGKEDEQSTVRRNKAESSSSSHRGLYEQLLQENNKAWKEELHLVQEENERLKRELSEAHARIRQLQLLGRQHQASMRPFRVLDSMLSQSTSESRDDDDSSVEVSLASSVDSGAITVKAGNTNKLRKRAQDNGPTAVSAEQHPLKYSPSSSSSSNNGSSLAASSKKKPKQKLKPFALFKSRSGNKRSKEKPETATAAAAIVEESTLPTWFEEESLDSVQTQCSISSYSTMSDSDTEYNDQKRRHASESLLQKQQQDTEAPSDDELEAIIAKINLEPEEPYE